MPPREAISNQDKIEKEAVFDGKSESPAPNSGDGIPDGSGMDSPFGKKK